MACLRLWLPYHAFNCHPANTNHFFSRLGCDIVFIPECCPKNLVSGERKSAFIKLLDNQTAASSIFVKFVFGHIFLIHLPSDNTRTTRLAPGGTPYASSAACSGLTMASTGLACVAGAILIPTFSASPATSRFTNPLCAFPAIITSE